MTWIERGLGLGDSDRHETEAEADSAAPDALPMPPDTPRRAARRQMLADIADFIMTHDLEVNTFTLSTAHDYLAGHDRHLTRAIDEKLGTREPLSQPWLEDAAQRSGGKDHGQALNRLMQRMEADLEAFSATTKSAQSATTDYNQTLEAHVGDLARPSGPPPVEELVSIARAMLERTRELEHEMERSAAQTRNLRRSLDDARRRADHDHLTGLPNRRAFEACFTKEYATAKSNGEQLCVAFCDIDHFKRINDTHGHDAGDRVLKVVADTLAHISNDRCHVARHGGEEFVVLLRGRSVHQAWELLDETRDQMARRDMVNRATDEPFGQVTFSAGLADVFAFDDPRSALGAADKALYQAKDMGRNRIVLAERPAKG
ncbi:MAG: GGDEF domain-containing protein [Sphingomonadales bacterium]|nr:GGDEF domain-containing protein [Sphingomonadales bacterium]MDE2170499.1 GGDEF domain-containing protein [Sphingomonadales bacterium]